MIERLKHLPTRHRTRLAVWLILAALALGMALFALRGLAGA